MKVDIVLSGTTLLILSSFVTLLQFEHTAGPDAPLAAKTPAETKGKLLCFVTPTCPCSISTLSNLRGASLPPNLAIEVIVTRTGEPGASDFVRTATRGWTRSLQITADPSGDIAQTLGALTSGLVILTDPSGRTAFRGGITSARGEAGSNAAVQALENGAWGWAVQRQNLPVYGCRL